MATTTAWGNLIGATTFLMLQVTARAAWEKLT
jgi:hypothetical protein